MHIPAIYNNVRTLACAALLSGVIFSAVSCRDSSAPTTPQPSAPDSTALRIALYPSIDALPFALANDWGIFDSLGVRAELAVFRSQMDAEKALADGQADAVLTDMFRVGWWQWRGRPMRYSFTTNRQLYIVPNKILRITRPDQLDDRMIACTRHSLEDYYTDRLIAKIKNRKGQILRPQINSVELRLSMLQAGQLDAAVLGTLQALKARAEGYPSLKDSSSLEDCRRYAGVAFNTNSLKSKGQKLAKLRIAYDIAVRRLQLRGEMPQIDSQTRASLFLNGIDSTINVKLDISLTSFPDAALCPVVAQWLNTRNATKNYTADTLLIQSYRE